VLVVLVKVSGDFFLQTVAILPAAALGYTYACGQQQSFRLAGPPLADMRLLLG
jgi:hypothetical protein